MLWNRGGGKEGEGERKKKREFVVSSFLLTFFVALFCGVGFLDF